jgi:hypothetical protein
MSDEVQEVHADRLGEFDPEIAARGRNRSATGLDGSVAER